VGSSRGHLALGATILAAAIGSSAAWGSSLRVLIRHSPNMTESNRTRSTIEGIVIHDTEGRFIGSVRFLQRTRTQGSAHFVVSRRGQIVQLVPVGDVAWHSGNNWWNLHSIGIEHEGWVGRRAYTEKEYRASAKLVAYLATRWGVPVDREHIIGHNEVPNPYHPGRFGGVSGHIDPGPYWNWGNYMGLVRYYQAHPVLPTFVKQMTVLPDAPVPRLGAWAARARTVLETVPRMTQPVPRAAARVLAAKARPHVVTRTVVHSTPVTVTAARPRRLAVARSTVDRNATVHGKALWWSGIDASRRWRRHIWKVDFLVDGKTLYTDHTWPFSFHRTVGWDSRTVANGTHMLAIRAYGTHHYRARKAVPVRVVNPPLRLRITGAVSGGAVQGLLSLGVRTNEEVDRVALYADGRLVSRDGAAPYRLVWNTRAAGEGDHSLIVYARGTHGTHRAALSLPVVVANAPHFPAALARNWVTQRPAASAFGVVDPER
jgi:N-acetyl-anhydromuramyl-L-alanine amidase AmpD